MRISSRRRHSLLRQWVPFDRSFKLLTDDDPRAALAAFAGIPLDAVIDVETVDRELNLSTLHVDDLYRCRRDGVEFLIHFEAVSPYRSNVIDRQADCSPRRAFRTTFLATSIAVMAIKRRGSGSAWFGFGRWTRRGAERRLLAAGDRKLLAMLSVLGGLRYGEKELFAERLGTMTLYEVFQDTYLYQEALEKGEARGERQMLSRQLTTRFGPLPAWASEQIAAAETEPLETWSVQLLTANSLEESLR